MSTEFDQIQVREIEVPELERLQKSYTQCQVKVNSNLVTGNLDFDDNTRVAHTRIKEKWISYYKVPYHEHLLKISHWYLIPRTLYRMAQESFAPFSILQWASNGLILLWHSYLWAKPVRYFGGKIRMTSWWYLNSRKTSMALPEPSSSEFYYLPRIDVQSGGVWRWYWNVRSS